MNLSALKQHFNTQLDIYPESERLVFFQRLCEAYLNLKPYQLVLNYSKEVPNGVVNSFEHALGRLKNHEPIQYILGTAYFFGGTYSVNPSVLIPRPETEELVAWILSHFDSKDAPTILDLGTGSGCIAVALAKALPHAQVFALDVSLDALEVARSNARKNNTKVNFIEGDMLDWSSKLCFDVVVSNPPYVCALEQNQMNENVLAHEPHLALFVSDDAPLIFYEALKNITQTNLKPNGLCFAEINEHYGNETKALFDALNFKNRVIKKDTFGKDRMLKAQKK
ncbi:MAG: peptide chain release factor N(5)-glutamine methyltransferase [Flavobacteriaceae bacterium]|nr:peptide chain release factor N(5)-glutamine methyltransferase [Flavobacteriaceae bacterium]